MISELIDKELIERSRQLTDSARRIVITTHMSPDGDAMGSSLALLQLLEGLGHEVSVVVPNAFPDFLAWMPRAGEVVVFDGHEDEARRLIGAADLIVCLDYNGLKRIGAVGPAVESSPARKLMIDHHLDPEPIADVCLSYPHQSSTCELIFRFISQQGWLPRLTRDIATCIYTGMMTDTGNFSYNSADPELYMILGRLLTLNIDKDEIYQRVFDNYTGNRLRFMGYCLYRKMRYMPQYHTALIALSGKELYQFHFQSGDAEGIVNIPLQIRDVRFSVFMREDKDKIKISLRSQGDFAVNTIAAELFSGGGHKNAAGGESHDSLQATVRRFMAALPRICPKD